MLRAQKKSSTDSVCIELEKEARKETESELFNSLFKLSLYSDSFRFKFKVAVLYPPTLSLFPSSCAFLSTFVASTLKLSFSPFSFTSIDSNDYSSLAGTSFTDNIGLGLHNQIKGELVVFHNIRTKYTLKYQLVSGHV